MSYAGLLTHRVNVVRATQAADGMGGWTTTSATIYHRLSARFNAMSGAEYAQYADKLGTQAGFNVFMEGGRDIREGDLLVKIDDNRQFDVRLKKDYDEQGKYLTLICSERSRKVV